MYLSSINSLSNLWGILEPVSSHMWPIHLPSNELSATPPSGIIPQAAQTRDYDSGGYVPYKNNVGDWVEGVITKVWCSIPHLVLNCQMLICDSYDVLITN